MRKFLICTAAALAISACSDGGADTDGDGKISDEEVAAEMNQVKLKAGEWENSIEIVDLELEGLPDSAPANMQDMIKEQMKSQMAQVSKTCITPEQAENPGADFFAAQEQTNCDVKEFDMSGGDVKADMSCDMGGAGKMDLVMTGEYGSESYDMEMTMDAAVQGMTIKMKAQNKAKYIGECPG